LVESGNGILKRTKPRFVYTELWRAGSFVSGFQKSVPFAKDVLNAGVSSSWSRKNGARVLPILFATCVLLKRTQLGAFSVLRIPSRAEARRTIKNGRLIPVLGPSAS
jgi:hypothetical protein